MLRVKSFDISDDKGINALLDKHSLAGGAHILVSEGKVCIPYEDGKPATNEQKISVIGEQKNKLYDQLAILEHSQTVLDLLMADAKNRVDVAQVNFDTADKSEEYVKADERKSLEKKLTEAEQALEMLALQHRSNAHEILRLNINIAKYDEQIDALSTDALSEENLSE